ncbi:MAG: hypothetical protein PVF58_19315 [Candidatus Methanofastidiosia archaeon]
MYKREYTKHIEIGTFLMEWVFLAMVIVPFMLFVSICLNITYNIAFFGASQIEPFIDEKFVYKNLEIAFSGAFLLSFISAGLKYRLTTKKNYASMTDKTLTLEFSNFTVFWHDITEIIIEGGRKLIIIYDNTKKEFDLQWLQKKKEFILNVNYSCAKNDILYRERELSTMSRIKLFFSSF